MRQLLLILILVAIAGFGFAQSGPRLSSMREIERLSIAAALTDYPLPASEVKETVGLPEYMPTILRGADFLLAALSDPEDLKGYFAIRIRYLPLPAPLPENLRRPADRPDTQNEPERMVSEIDILFCTPLPGLTFKFDQDASLWLRSGAMRARMKEKKMTPRQFSEELISSREKGSEIQPNKSPEATPGQRPPGLPSPSSGAPQL
jgi:hypothetical protein